MTSFAGGGGGSIYEDGDPVNEELASGESITVPAGATWVVTITITSSSNPGELLINDTEVLSAPSGEESEKVDVVLSGGDGIFIKRGGIVSGWDL